MGITLGDQTIWQQQGLEYLRYEYPLKPTDLVFDIGSYRNEFANEIIARYGCRVECFEALDNRAAATYDGKMRMGGAFYYSSAMETEKHTEYDCVDIARMMTEPIALMKVNIEGYEYFLLRYILSKGLMQMVEYLQVQFHLIEGQDCEGMYQVLAAQLSETHELQWRYNFVWESWKRKPLH